MAQDIIMPQLGESIAEGTIVKWLKSAGEAVKKDENILLISTDKVEAEIPSPNAGVLLEILVGPGETVAVGTLLGRVGEAHERANVASSDTKKAQDSTNEAPKTAPASQQATKPPRDVTDSSSPQQPAHTQTEDEESEDNGDMSGFYSPLVKLRPKIELVKMNLAVLLAQVAADGFLKRYLAISGDSTGTSPKIAHPSSLQNFHRTKPITNGNRIQWP